jgi:hypothetical protein
MSMVNKKQTAVEWLVDEIEKHYIINNGTLNPTVVMELRRQAKTMEKEQIEESFKHARLPALFGSFQAKDYYNETYEKNR